MYCDSTRADWGLLSGIARELNSREDVCLQIVATNMHLSENTETPIRKSNATD